MNDLNQPIEENPGKPRENCFVSTQFDEVRRATFRPRNGLDLSRRAARIEAESQFGRKRASLLGRGPSAGYEG